MHPNRSSSDRVLGSLGTGIFTYMCLVFNGKIMVKFLVDVGNIYDTWMVTRAETPGFGRETQDQSFYLKGTHVRYTKLL